MPSKHYHNKGFGLIESVVSMGILVVFLGGALGLIRISLQNTVLSSDRTQAYNLIQEKIEKVRQMTQTTWIDGQVNNWSDPLKVDGTNVSGGPYHIETISKKFVLLPGSGSDVLDNKEYTSEIKIFANSTNDFSLPLWSNSPSNPDLVGIYVKVSWQEYGKTWDSQLRTIITNWKST